MGDKKIKRHHIRSLAVVLAPLFLGGCGLPVGVQIASLLADGLSFLTTEKTLGDHGLSAIAGKDCAVWRGINGEEICRDNGTETAAAKAESQSHIPVDTMSDVYVWDFHEATPTPKPTEVATAPQKPSWTDPDPAEVMKFPATPPPVPSVTVAPVSMETVSPEPPAEIAAAEPAKPAPKPAAQAPDPAPTAKTLRGGTFYVIASYRGISYARRFASRQEGLVTKVLTGTAGGMSVYRVAVGPVAEADREAVRDGLIGYGFNDVWALDLKNPKEAVELASLL